MSPWFVAVAFTLLAMLLGGWYLIDLYCRWRRRRRSTMDE